MDTCELKALLFILALFRSIIRGERSFPEVLAASVLGSLTLLAAPFAWGKSMLAAAEGCDNLKADAQEAMSFVGMLQFNDPLLALPELFEAMQGVSSDSEISSDDSGNSESNKQAFIRNQIRQHQQFHQL